MHTCTHSSHEHTHVHIHHTHAHMHTIHEHTCTHITRTHTTCMHTIHEHAQTHITCTHPCAHTSHVHVHTHREHRMRSVSRMAAGSSEASTPGWTRREAGAERRLLCGSGWGGQGAARTGLPPRLPPGRPPRLVCTPRPQGIVCPSAQVHPRFQRPWSSPRGHPACTHTPWAPGGEWAPGCGPQRGAVTPGPRGRRAGPGSAHLAAPFPAPCGWTPPRASRGRRAAVWEP